MSVEMVQSYAIPSKCATKSLRMKTSSNGKRKIVISTNWLVLFGFEAGSKVTEDSIGDGMGIVIRKLSPADRPAKSKMVYSRNYGARKNNPLETLMDVSSQKLINRSFSSSCTRVHVVFEDGKVTVTPFSTHKERALKNATVESKNQLFAACSSGVDVHFMEQHGFSCSFLLDHRPCEARDNKRKSKLNETGALTALRNSKGIKGLFNEDINTISTDMLKKACKDDPFTVMSASIQCNDFCNVKSNSLKEKSVEELSTSIDMAYDLMRIVEALAPPVVLLEQVKGFYNSEIFRMLDVRFRRWGYQSNLLLANASDFGGLTLRPRGYAVYSCLPVPFSFEDKFESDTSPWEAIKHLLPECRDVSENKSIKKGTANGRLRSLTPDSKSCPTILKSQPRQACDSVTLFKNGKHLWPSENVLKTIMGIGDDFNLDCVSKDIASEIIGQSVDGPFQKMIARCVKKHIDAYEDAFLKKYSPTQMQLF